MLDDMFDGPQGVKEEQPVKVDDGSVHFADLIDSDYRMYSMYTIENRAIPSYIDGMKPVQRKLFYAMQMNKGRKIKAAEIGGSLSSYGYAHGETSAQDAVVKMAQAWAMHIPFFKGHGNFGDRMIKEASSPRYIYVSEEERIKEIFSDNDVLPVRTDDHPEPQTYLPLIPWLLAAGSQGVAVGFATKVLPRDPKQLREACVSLLEGKPLSQPLVPSYPGFRGSIEANGENGWKISGVVEPGKRATEVVVTEVPFSYDREKFYEHLCELEEGSKIVSFSDYCDSNGINFRVKLTKEQKEKLDIDPLKYLGLTESVKENFTTLDETGKLKIFDGPEQLIQEFLRYRITKKADQINFDIKKIEANLDFLKVKLDFIERVLSIGTSTVATWKVSEFRKFASSSTAIATQLINIPLYSMTKEEIEKLKAKIKVDEDELTRLNKLDPKEELKRCIKSLKL